MIVTDTTRRSLAYRREERAMIQAGWEKVGDDGGKLWELHRGYRWRERIADVRIAIDGKSLWVRIEEDLKL